MYVDLKEYCQIMKENTNQSIVFNSLILYVRLAIVSVCGLLYTRYSLQALGVVHYGLFSVVGGIISFIAILNTIMIATSNRFISVAIGRNDMNEANNVFNVNLIIHIMIALFTIVFSMPLGHYYIGNYINYQGDVNDVFMVFDITLIASAFSFIGVPYNGLLIARERFYVFCLTDILSSVFKLIGTYLLIYHFEEKLLVYALITAIMTAYPTVAYLLYCHRQFPEITRFSIVKEKEKYKEVFRFASGIAVGAISFLAKNQGTALIINAFFSTVMNSALAIANSVNTIVQLFANNIQKSISPQIVKSYAADNIERSTYLVCFSSKVTYMVMFGISIPFFLIPETLFSLWLKEIPDYAITLTRLMIIDVLILSINAGISEMVWATGKILTYQILTNIISLSSVIVGFLILRSDYPVESLFYCYIAFSFLLFVVRPYILVRTIHFNVRQLYLQSYLPAILLTLLFLPICLFNGYLNPWIYISVAMGYYVILAFYVVLRRNERKYIIDLVKSKVSRFC